MVPYHTIGCLSVFLSTSASAFLHRSNPRISVLHLKLETDLPPFPLRTGRNGTIRYLPILFHVHTVCPECVHLLPAGVLLTERRAITGTASRYLSKRKEWYNMVMAPPVLLLKKGTNCLPSFDLLRNSISFVSAVG